jgi:hypothetical protein
MSQFSFRRLWLVILTFGVIFAGAEARIFAADFRPLLQEAVKEGRAEVVIPPGIYRMTAKPRSPHIYLHDVRNLTIVATGVTMICEKLSRAIAFENCHNVTLKGLTVDYDPLPFTQGTVIRVADDRDSIDVALHAGYPREAYSRIDICDPKTRFRKRGMPFLWGTKTEWVDANTVRVKLKGIGDTAAIGDMVSLSGAAASDGIPHGITVDNCGGMTFADVTVYTAPGMGIIEAGGEGGMRYLRCRVVPGPRPPGADQDRLLSTVWDAMQTSETRKGPVVEDCQIASAGDDSWSVQSDDYLVLKATGHEIVVGFSNPYSTGPLPGDHLQMSLDGKPATVAKQAVVTRDEAGFSPEVLQKLATAKNWTPWHVSGKFARLTLDQDDPFPVGQSIYCPDQQCNGFIFRHNHLHSPGRILIKAGDGLIEENEVRDGHSGVTVCPEVLGSGAAGIANLIIRKNLFFGTGYFCPLTNSSQSGCVSISAEGDNHQLRPPGIFRDITIEDNRFQEINGPCIVVTSASQVAIRRNAFIRPFSTPPNTIGRDLGIDSAALVWVAETSNLLLQDNTVSDPGPYGKIELKEGHGVTGISGSLLRSP